MEGIVGPINLDDWGEPFASFFRRMRSDAGDEMVLDKNLFVEGIPFAVVRELSAEEMAEYRRPFAAAGEDRRPTLSWPRQLRADDEPAEVVEIVERNAEWMSQVDIPKLLINSEPGCNIMGRTRDLSPLDASVSTAGRRVFGDPLADGQDALPAAPCEVQLGGPHAP